MRIHHNILTHICHGNLSDYIEYVDLLYKEIKEILDSISHIHNNFEKPENIIKLRYNVHKLISHICYLENNEEPIHLCRYILFQPKKELDSICKFNYLYYTKQLLEYQFKSLF